MPTFRPASALTASLMLAGLAGLTGCQTEGGFGATMGDLRDTIGGAIGIEPAAREIKSDIKEPLQTIADHQRGVRDRVQLAYDELDTLARTPEGELDTQHAAYTQALRDVREQTGVTTRLRGEALSAADTYSARVTRTLTQKVSNPGLRNVAQRNLDLFETSVADAIGTSSRYDVDLSPLLARFDHQAATLKGGATAESVGRVRSELTQLKGEVQGVLNQLDQQVVKLEDLVDQVDVIDASMTPLGL